MKTLALFDIDGTISNDLHRQTYSKALDWNSYFSYEMMFADPLYREGADLISCAQERGFEIGYLTGRREDTRACTQAWLENHVLPLDTLWMKPLNCSYRTWDYKALFLKALQISDNFDRVVLYENNLKVASTVARVCGPRSVVLCGWQLESFDPTF